MGRDRRGGLVVAGALTVVSVLARALACRPLRIRRHDLLE